MYFVGVNLSYFLFPLSKRNRFESTPDFHTKHRAEAEVKSGDTLMPFL